MVTCRSTVALSLLWLASSGCSDTPSAPSASPSKTIGGITVSAPPSGPSGSLSSPAPISVVGFATGCIDRATMDAQPNQELLWEVVVRDAGPRGILRFASMAFHEDVASCDPTIANPRDRIKLAAGETHYAAHGQGISYFAAPANEWTCGRAQFDIAIDDGVSPTEIVTLKVNYGTNCVPAPPTTPAICPPKDQILAGAATWGQTDADRVKVAFIIRPDLPAPVRLSLASYQMGPGVGYTLPQHLVATFEGIYQPGHNYEIDIVMPTSRAQVDLLTCGAPTVDLTAANAAEWNAKTIDWRWF